MNKAEKERREKWKVQFVNEQKQRILVEFRKKLIECLADCKTKDEQIGQVVLALHYCIIDLDGEYSYLLDQIENNVKPVTLEGFEEWSAKQEL